MSRSTRSKLTPSAILTSKKPKASPKPASPRARKPASPAPEQSRVKDVFSVVESTSLESRLVDVGYTPQGKVVVDQRTLFVRVLDRNCNSAYVFVDEDAAGYVVSSDSDLATEEQGDGGLLPMSTKKGLASLFGSDLYGVAVECDDSVVTLRLEPSGDLVEHRYRFNANDDARAQDGFSLLPIVRMADLLGAPEEVQTSLARAVVVLDNERFSQLSSSLSDMDSSITRMRADFDRCRETFGSLYKAITDTLQQLQSYNSRFLDSPPVDEEAKEKWADVRFNISVRRDYLGTLFRCMAAVESNRKALQDAAFLMEESLDCCSEKIVSVDTVIPRT